VALDVDELKLDEAGGDVSDPEASLSKAELQGSSRTTGGIIRHRALGNAPNLADLADIAAESQQPDLQLMEGKVLIWEVQPDDMDSAKPYRTKVMPVHSTLGPVLKTLGNAWATILDKTISLYQDDAWDIKGPFKNAINEDEHITWDKQDGKFTLRLLAETSKTTAPSSSPVASKSKSKDKSKKPKEELGPYQLELIKLLDIPKDLTDREEKVDIQAAFRKFKGYIDAVREVKNSRSVGNWEGRIPTQGELQKCFFSISMWHSNYRPYFLDIGKWPQMKEWLEGGSMEGAQSVWGWNKKGSQLYSWADLKRWKEKNKNNALKGKAKSGSEWDDLIIDEKEEAEEEEEEVEEVPVKRSHKKKAKKSV
ncbi:hypothetical protein BDN72DRAFT_907056, partial [Pluteus cervinus]